MERELTAKEKKAVAALKRVAKNWPQSLTLFSMSGSLVIFDSEDFAKNACYAEELESIHGIPNDGGDR